MMGRTVTEAKNRPHVNFRPLLFCALSLVVGISLCFDLKFGSFSPIDLIPFLLLFFFVLRPFGRRRICFLLACVIGAALTGALCAHLYTVRYESGVKAGEYEVTGVVVSFTVYGESTYAELSTLTFDGKSAGGRATAVFPSDEVRAGDVLAFHASVTRFELPARGRNTYRFTNDIRYRLTCTEFEKTGMTELTLRLNSALYECLTSDMGRDEAAVSYALLTGNSSAVDEGLLESVREGGIAHIFAVSGLHIGILFSAVFALFSLIRPIRRYACLFALPFAVFYAGLSGFTVSAVRALIMCAVLGVHRVLGRKNDFVGSISVAAIFTLCFFPAEWLSVGFRLSYGACVGLALFSGSFTRGLRKIRFPVFLANGLSASLSVQLFTFPILLQSFGYVSVWGTLLNLLLIPLLPALFFVLFSGAGFALVIPPAAPFFLAFPSGMISALLFVLAVCDFSFVLAGFSIGAGAAVLIAACVLLSPRVRFSALCRGLLAGFFALLFAATFVYENAVFYGCRVSVWADGGAVLVRTESEAVLIVGEASLSECERFLNRAYGGRLSAVVVVSENEVRALNVAAFLPADAIYARDEVETGLWETSVIFAERFRIGALDFCYEARDKIAVTAEGLTVELDFTGEPVLGADFFIGNAQGGQRYFFHGGKGYTL